MKYSADIQTFVNSIGKDEFLQKALGFISVQCAYVAENEEEAKDTLMETDALLQRGSELIGQTPKNPTEQRILSFVNFLQGFILHTPDTLEKTAEHIVSLGLIADIGNLGGTVDDIEKRVFA